MRRTFRTSEDARVLLEVADGRRPAARYLEGGTLLNVYSGELYSAGVAIARGRIAYVGPGRAMVGRETDVVAVPGRTLVPGYVDPHTHLLGVGTPVAFARELLRTGTTSVIADSLPLIQQTPPDLTAEALTALSRLPLRIYWSLRLDAASALPDESMFAAERLAPLLQLDSVRAAGEITRWPALYRGGRELFEKIALAQAAGLRIEGHAPGASYDRLAGLAAVGWSADHEAITAEEVLARLRAGVYPMLRHSSLRPDVPALAKAVTLEHALSARLMLATDGPEPVTIVERGYMDRAIREAMTAGIPPALAYQMATLNPAAYFALDEEIGGIGPGRRADIAVLPDLRDPTPELVLAGGEIVVRDGRAAADIPDVAWDRYFPPRFRAAWTPDPSWFETRAGDLGAAGADAVEFPVMRLENSVITRRRDVAVPVSDGVLAWPPDVVRAALMDPDGRWVTSGALTGFADRLGGLASSFNIASHLLVLGQEPADMARAARRALELGGGIVAVEHGQVALELPLPIGGLMAPGPLAPLVDRLRSLYAFLRARGYPHDDVFYTLLFLPVDSLPDLRLSYRGVWDVRRAKTLVARRDL